MICLNSNKSGHPTFKCLKPLLKCSYCHLIDHVLADCPKKSSQCELTEKSVIRIRLDVDSEAVNIKPNSTKSVSQDISDGNIGSKYKMVIKINKVPIACQVDLGSEAILIRKTDAQNFGLKWKIVDGPMLRGLCSVPYFPLGKLQDTIDMHGIDLLKGMLRFS